MITFETKPSNSQENLFEIFKEVTNDKLFVKAFVSTEHTSKEGINQLELIDNIIEDSGTKKDTHIMLEIL